MRSVFIMKTVAFRLRFFPLLLIAQAVTVPGVMAQAGEAPPKYEFRGAWVATVLRLDWPEPSSSQAQQEALIDLLDGLKEAGINAVFFQIRSEADAMYASEIEPWSYWLTGVQGHPPDPFYDPLALAVAEAHERGMELHAWVNPYRVVRGSGYAQAPGHVSQQHPEWLLAFGDVRILDPGLPAVRDYITAVLLDVVRRYDVDGIHFDDFFYPYPPNAITNQDDASFAADPRGFTDRGDWRRDNVNRFVAQVYDSLRAVRPEVKFGISPFGIWGNGVPPGIVGLDAYDVIYADALAWLGDGTVDYLVPQLYWPFGGGQDYGALAPWWASQAFGRHLYAGHGLYKADPATAGGSLFSPREVPDQVRFNRADPGILGSVFFRAANLTALSSQGFADSLKADLYRTPALTPSMAWKDETPPGAPVNLAYERIGAGTIRLGWEPPASPESPAPRRYAVYRVRADAEPDAGDVLADARNLIAVTGATSVTDTPEPASERYFYAVTAVSANTVESTPSPFVQVDAQAVAVEDEGPPGIFQRYENYPNPFTQRTEIRFTLVQPAAVTLRVYNVLGQVVATLLDGARQAAGTHAVQWSGQDDAGQPVSSGSYFYTLEAASQRVTGEMVLVR